MTGGERAQVLLTARLLEAASKLDLLSTGLTLIAVAHLVFLEPGHNVGAVRGVGTDMSLTASTIAIVTMIACDPIAPGACSAS